VLAKVQEFTSSDTDASEWNLRGLADWVNLNFPVGMAEDELPKVARSGRELPVAGSLYDGLKEGQFALVSHVGQAIREAYNLKVSFERPEALASVERYTILAAIDRLWQEHLYSMDSLRSSIVLRAYGQRDPLIEYKAEAFKLFDELMVNIKTEICHNIFRSASSLMAFEQFLVNLPKLQVHQSVTAFGGDTSGADPLPGNDPASGGQMVSEAAAALEKAKPVRATPRVGRNDACPCGSGKKYKSCCGQ